MAVKAKHSKRRGCLFRVLPSVIVLTLLVWMGALFFSHKCPKQANYTHQLTILTYNTLRAGMYKKPPHNGVIRYLQQQDADIVCLQEVDVYKRNKYLTLPEFRDAMKKYPYSYYDFKIHNGLHQFGIVVFSKYPLINKNTIPYTSRGNISNYCDVVVGKDTLRLFNNHLESNNLVAEDLPDSLATESFRNSAQRISDKLGSARSLRNEQARIVRKHIKESPYPVIVVGDFNSIPLSYAYLKIRGCNLRDCFLETSIGRWGSTLTKGHIGIRIDYVLCSKSLSPVATHIDKVNYSDHYPLTATIGW